MSLPQSKLDGKLISLRWMRSDDADGSYFDWMAGNLFTEYLENYRDPITREKLREYIEIQNNNSNTYFFGICKKNSSVLIGTVKLSLIDWVARTSAIGIILGPAEVRGKGNGRDALQTVCHFAFHHLNLYKLYAGISSNNLASQGSFEGAGFKQEAIRPNQLWLDGAYQDQILYAIYNEN